MQVGVLERPTSRNPVIDGETVTFLWHGQQAPLLIGDFCQWQWGTPLPLAHVKPALWSATLQFPSEAYIEYAFWDGKERVADPLNLRTVPDGLGHRNHFFYMPAAQPAPFVRRSRGVTRGTLTRHVVEDGFLVVGGRRTVRLYVPCAPGPYRLLVVLDGQGYHPRGRILPIVDNLVSRGRIPPLALALVNHGRQARGVEYACSEATLRFLTGPVLGLARERLDLAASQGPPGAHGILGASMGGLMALFAGLRAPELFGRVLSQSGAFDFGEAEPALWDLLRHGPVLPLRIWMDAGRYEWLLEPNRRLHQLLAEKGWDATYREHSGGHNYTSWRNDLPRALEHLFAA